ncbi:flavin reductase (DIM6/NTAB) family NADH-FMN oxidoreductase RutF [Paenarthrobacter nitroguajacolicus]|uniref:flavin reductase family protein n=1 Tax=Paenarthrobacter nitroguajacolicus TaxID=211146 RepID=UPI00285869C5|nr:flavin reductase family protein [Paenarthrobacter nitroguajacolicus]MDR6989151.1 flavin reductase (DIM6/NTAB) family NADH-FMN oxidoreductase RutF [Paenarthrobacter nitroguajacolicus]
MKTTEKIPVTVLPTEGTDEVASELINQIRLAHRAFPSGVTVVTAESDGAPVGLAVNAFSSVSMSPPMVLVCVNASSRSHDALAASDHLAVSILSHSQTDIAGVFAKSGGDKFSQIEWHTGANGAPIVDGASATFELEVVSRVEAGTHSVFFGRILRADTSGLPPLLYADGRFFDSSELLAS